MHKYYIPPKGTAEYDIWLHGNVVQVYETEKFNGGMTRRQATGYIEWAVHNLSLLEIIKIAIKQYIKIKLFNWRIKWHYITL